jgi:hypothetical protein
MKNRNVRYAKSQHPLMIAPLMQFLVSPPPKKRVVDELHCYEFKQATNKSGNCCRTYSEFFATMARTNTLLWIKEETVTTTLSVGGTISERHG